MRKVIVFTDVHISKTGPMMRGGKSRLEYVKDSINFMCNYAMDNQIDLAINCGDLTSSDTLSAEENQTLVQVLTALGQTFRHTYHVLGNHEKRDINGEFTSIEAIELADRNTLIKDLCTIGAYGPTIMFVPYTEDIEPIREFLNSPGQPNPSFVFSHLTLTPAGEFFQGLDTSAFSISGNVYNGHIHNPSHFDGNIINVGSLLGSNFGDDYSVARPGFIVIDLDRPGWYERVENEKAPLYFKVDSIIMVPNNVRDRSYVKLNTSDVNQNAEGLAGLALNLEGNESEYKKVELGDKGVYEALHEFYDKMPEHQSMVDHIIKEMV